MCLLLAVLVVESRGSLGGHAVLDGLNFEGRLK